MTRIIEYVDEISTALRKAVASDLSHAVLDLDSALYEWVNKTKFIADARGTIFFCGNGASAAMAEHMSHDFFQNADILTYTVSETSHLTAISNDVSFEDVFAYRISKMCNNKDMLVTISSSGDSPNIIKAIKTARNQGMSIVTLSGKTISNKSRQLGDLNFFVPLETYGLVESAHAILLHYWLDLFLDIHKGGKH